MSISIVDKRNVKRDRSTENRTRFLKRIKQAIKEQMPEILNGRSMKNYTAGGDKVKINRKTISEPTIYHGQGGNVDRVLPGNDDWVEDDLIDKPPNGGGPGRGRAGRGKSEDEFIIELSREEFLKFFFEDLELPDMLTSELAKIKTPRRENAGFQTDGSPNRLAVLRSYKQSLKRRLPLEASYDEKIKKLEEEIAEMEKVLAAALKLPNVPVPYVWEHETKLAQLKEELKELKLKRSQINVFEDMDLRYRSSVRKEEPIAHATMIMIMDNSGSMGQKEKTIARKFFWLLYSFLERQYDAVEMIFISHTDDAHEMDEDEFFNTRESGGTIVSSALDLAVKIIKDRCHDTNIYVAQVSDGDNYDTDNGTCSEILEDDLLPKVRYMAYIQVDDYHDDHSDGASPNMYLNFDRGLWTTYESVSGRNKKLQIKRVFNEKDIFPVFRELFKKKTEATK